MDERGKRLFTVNLQPAFGGFAKLYSFLSRKNVAFIKYGCSITSVKRIRPVKKLPEVISRETIKALFASIDTGSITGKRDFALFNVMYSTATRVDEVLSLKIADIALGSKSPCIRGDRKGKQTPLHLSSKKRGKNHRSLYIRVPWESPCSIGLSVLSNQRQEKYEAMSGGSCKI